MLYPILCQPSLNTQDPFIFPGFWHSLAAVPCPITHAKEYTRAAPACWMLLLPSGMGLCPLPWLHIPTHLLERLNLLMEKLHSPLRQPGKQKFICYWQIKRKCSIPGHLLSIRNYRNETKPQILPKPKALGCSSKYPNTLIFVMQKIHSWAHC